MPAMVSKCLQVHKETSAHGSMVNTEALASCYFCAASVQSTAQLGAGDPIPRYLGANLMKREQSASAMAILTRRECKQHVNASPNSVFCLLLVDDLSPRCAWTSSTVEPVHTSPN